MASQQTDIPGSGGPGVPARDAAAHGGTTVPPVSGTSTVIANPHNVGASTTGTTVGTSSATGTATTTTAGVAAPPRPAPIGGVTPSEALPPNPGVGDRCVPIGSPEAVAFAQKQAKAAQDDHPNPAAVAAGRLKKDLDELKEYASFYVSTKIDGVKRTVRNVGLYAALGVVGAIVGGAMLATAAGLIVVGIGNGLSVLFGHRYWLGYTLTGLLILGAVAGAAYWMMNKLTGAWRSSTIKKYEQRKQTQRARFGHDVAERAAANAAATAAARAASRAK
jgi:hypothetical protein